MMNDNDTNEINFEDVPEEVMDFLYSDEYQGKLEKIANTFSLSNEQKELMRGYLNGLLTQTITYEEFTNSLKTFSTHLTSNGSLIETVEKDIVSAVQEIVTESLNEAELEDDLQSRLNLLTEEGADTTNYKPNIATAPSPTQALASIKERLSQASTIAPTKRDYSVERGGNTQNAPQDTVKPAIDPYRELPEK